ncbi:HEPN domain-containing protein [Reinekea thalattae]|uniref:HEPN domain-containing protein n=1 Tax=Reinekea thalattae TaxID=2593301 RepID=A0A5C8Z522_9GAMM|nr:HEPN domain-containing protein [Reinekea thalattae]TXR53122.1 HEPN domain-containing protein [Reinekea thalattae]
MDEFFKTKVGFTIGLLAAVFAFKPLVDSNSGAGFSVFNIKITIGYAYVFLTASLGLAVYFISLQFASSKHVKTFDAISDTCYSIALATPPVFLAFWLITITFSYIGSYVSQISVYVVNFLAGVLSSILAGVIYSLLQKSIKTNFLKTEKQQERKEDIESLAKAKELINIGMYDLSFLESSKIVESALRRLLVVRGISIKKGSMIDLVHLSEKHRILSSEEIKFINEIRRKRNESVHSIHAVDKTSADRVLQISRELISKLDEVTQSSGYEWLKNNREKVIQQFKEGDLQKSRHALSMLKEAWKNRDGAAWLHMSDFFEVALTSNPELIVTMFEYDEELLDSWLERAGIQLFTDFLGGEKDRLIGVRFEIISQLNKYINSTNKKNRIKIANKILSTIEESEVREVD